MAKINTDSKKIQDFLTRGIENIYPNKAFLEKLLKSGKQLTIYYGIDPTGPSLHLGHAINLEKLRLWQDLGHKVIILIGDFTATIGDPTDKAATRRPLTRQQVMQNAKLYKTQAGKFLKFTGANKAEIKYNNSWLNKMNFEKVLDLASNFTVQQLLERDMFQKRLKHGKPISVHEFLYPLLQAYDSVALDTDGELGGNDQTFNMLSGRDLMKILSKKEKFVITMKLLTDTAGIKMGKSEGNMVSFTDSPKEMFGKVMSWTDNMILNGYELCTRVPSADLKGLAKKLQTSNPRDLKFDLAKKIVALYYDAVQADKAATDFENVFSRKGIPEDIQNIKIPNKKLNPIDLIVTCGFTASRGEARRLIEGGGLKINSQKVTDWKKEITVQSGDVIQAGKRKFAKVS